MAIDFGKAEVAQPCELKFHWSQTIGRIFIRFRDPERAQEPRMQRRAARENMLQVQKYPAGP